MTDLLALSARFIDQGVFEGRDSINRVNAELSEIADGIAVIESFSHVIAFQTSEGLLVFDTSLEDFAELILKSLRGWSDDPIHTMVYTHGHVDHVGGAEKLIEDTLQRGGKRPRIVAHQNLVERFDRYRYTGGYNYIVNQRQFGRGEFFSHGGLSGPKRFGPRNWHYPDTTLDDRMGLRVGELEVDIHHAKGETDDHLWAWIPEKKALVVGDLVIWVFPNAGNPQKVQRYARQWAQALRAMAAMNAELLLPSHGLPVAGSERIRRLLGDTAEALESLEQQTVEMMNQGEPLDAILHSVRPPEHLSDRPYLQPVYDEPEFVVRNIWRLYGGWYDGNPANLKPAPNSELAAELCRLAGGASHLVSRARELCEAGQHRLACHLVELAVQAEPEDRQTHAARSEIYTRRRQGETSLMTDGIFRWAASQSKRIAERDE